MRVQPNDLQAAPEQYMETTGAGLVAHSSRARPSQDVLVPHLRDVRLSRALSQRDLADASRVSRSTIMALEAGRDAWPRTVQKLARALRVKPEELTGRRIRD